MTDSPGVRLAATIQAYSSANMSRRRLAVLDTGPMLNDVMRSAALQAPSPLCVAIQTGVFRAFVARHVWAEIPRNLEKRAGQLGLNYEHLLWVWFNWYLPSIHVVDCTDLPATPESMQLERRDRDDVDTLRLAGLVAPAMIVAEDPDVLASQLAYEQWRDLYELVVALDHGQAQLLGSEFAVQLGVATLSAGGRGIAKLVSSPTGRWIGLATFAALLLAGKRWGPNLASSWSKGRETRQALADEYVGLFTAVADRLAKAHAVWTAAERGTAGTSLLHRVARVLATADQPMTRTEIAHALDLTASRGNLKAIGEELTGNRAFIPVEPYRWQLGLDDANLTLDWSTPPNGFTPRTLTPTETDALLRKIALQVAQRRAGASNT